jgi:DNA polymerase-3 subunit gamma/tau
LDNTPLEKLFVALLPMSQALYRKWRPGRWEEVVGQPHVVQPLRNAVAAGREGHAYLFAGPRGTGKTTVARILAKAVNCLEEDLAKRPCDKCNHCKGVNAGSFLDLIEIDAASNTSVEDVRDLRDKINFSPNQGCYKVYIIDEVHMLSTAAFNALLKTLEEPPPHAIFVLATTEVHKIPATVLSRCQRHEFRRIPVVDIVAHIKSVAKKEKIKIESEALQVVARQSTGSLRDAISMLDQLSAFGDTITVDMAQTILGTATSQAVLDLMDAILKKDVTAGLDIIHATLDGGSDPRQFTRQIVDYLRNVLLVRMDNAGQVDTTPEVKEQMARHAQAFERPELLRVIHGFNQAATETRNVWQPSLPLELAFIEAVEAASIEYSSPPGAPSGNPSGEKQRSNNPKKPNNPNNPTTSKAAKSLHGGGALAQNWSEICNLVKIASPNTTGLLNLCDRELRDGVLYLHFSSDMLKMKMEQENHLTVLKQAITQVLGAPMDIRCLIASGGKGTLPSGVDNSGLVATAMRLGGEIVDTNKLNRQTGE